MLAVDMAAAERRIHSALDAHISELRQQIESEERSELTKQVKQQVGVLPDSLFSREPLEN